MIAETAPADTATASSFAAALRVHTQGIHREAERAGYVADLIRGRATREGYAVYLRNLLPAYDALEAGLRAGSADAPARMAFANPALRRGDALRADIRAITGEAPDGRAALPEAEAYALAIEGAARSGNGLVGHAYARYLGDLSGGQILKPLLARTLGLASDALTFYDFPGLADLDASKADLRRALDTIEAGSPEGSVILDEAMSAFRHTIAVSTAVSRAVAVPAEG